MKACLSCPYWPSPAVERLSGRGHGHDLWGTTLEAENRQRYELPAINLATHRRADPPGRSADEFYTLTSHDNPKDVIAHVASPQFGEFRSSV